MRLNKEQYQVGSLFAGVGGMCQAFKNVSCKVIWANEIDKRACSTYKLNHKSTLLIEDDVRNISKKNLKKIDILTAGFPCQPFSQAGHGKGFDDDRGKLFFELIRLLKELKPRAYLLENVKTLVTHDDGNSFSLVKDELKKADYSFIPFVLNAAEYTNIPQGRERIYIVGFKGEPNFSYNKPIKVNDFADINCKLSASFKIPLKSRVPPKKINEFLEPATVLESDMYNNINSKIHKRVIDAVIDSSTVYQYRRFYVRENKSNVCPTLTANMGGGGHNIPIVLDENFKFPRRITPKECFNLQGFPKKFKLPIDVALGQLYKQAGNAVVVPMVQKIAKGIVKVLDENKRRRNFA